jgi:hypothetical protein
MLRACVLNDGPKWDQHLPLAEFYYNNSYQEPDVTFRGTLWTSLPYTTEQVKQIRANLLTTQSRQQSYTDK